MHATIPPIISRLLTRRAILSVPKTLYAHRSLHFISLIIVLLTGIAVVRVLARGIGFLIGGGRIGLRVFDVEHGVVSPSVGGLAVGADVEKGGEEGGEAEGSGVSNRFQRR